MSHVQQFLPTDYPARLKISPELLSFCQVDVVCHDTGNTQNWCVSGNEKSHSILQVTLHSQNVTVWYGFTAKYMIVPFFVSMDES